MGRFLWTQPGAESCSEQYANPWSTNKMFDLDKTRASTCPDQVSSSPIHVHPPNLGSLFPDFSSMASGTKKKGCGRGMKLTAASCLFEVKGQPCSLIHTPPTHVEDWAVGSPSQVLYKRSCKNLTIGNKMWFSFSVVTGRLVVVLSGVWFN